MSPHVHVCIHLHVCRYVSFEPATPVLTDASNTIHRVHIYDARKPPDGARQCRHAPVHPPKAHSHRPNPRKHITSSRTRACLLHDLGRLLLCGPQLGHAPGRHGSSGLGVCLWCWCVRWMAGAQFSSCQRRANKWCAHENPKPSSSLWLPRPPALNFGRRIRADPCLLRPTTSVGRNRGTFDRVQSMSSEGRTTG